MELTTEKNSHGRFKFVPFSSFDKWYVSYYINPYEIKSPHKIVLLKELIHPKKERIKLQDYKGNLRVVKKISFKDGVIHLRKENETKMDLYTLNTDDLLVSKINFHQGAIAINRYQKIVCTTHYQPYSINRQFVIDEYLVLYLRSRTFQNYISFIRAEGIKNEATYEFIGSLPVPLPSIDAQEKILATYCKAICKAEEQEQQAKRKEEEINPYLFDCLEVNLEKTERATGISFIKHSLIDRWAADYLFNLNSIKGITKGKYPVLKVRNFLLSYQYGLSTKATEEPIGIPMLRMNNINNGELDIEDLKYIKIDNEKKQKVFLNKGDLLFNRTNSKELVGKTAVFELDDEYTFASYLIRLKLDDEKVNTHYINYLFNSPIGRIQIDMVSRQVLGQANVNAQELQDFVFPIPEMTVQNEIANEIEKVKKAIQNLREKAEQNRQAALTYLEKAIFKN